MSNKTIKTEKKEKSVLKSLGTLAMGVAGLAIAVLGAKNKQS